MSKNKVNEDSETVDCREDEPVTEILRRCGAAGMSKWQTFHTLRAYKGYVVAKKIYDELQLELPTEAVEAFHKGIADRDMVVAETVIHNLEKGAPNAVSEFMQFDRTQRIRNAIEEMTND